MSALARLALLLGLRTAPADAFAPVRIHRGEPEFCAGTDSLGAPWMATAPTAKLSADEALRCFGVRQGGREA